jgi:hypothetical protein
MDRLEPIQMPSYTDEEKIAIGRDYLLPKAIQESGLSPQEIQIARISGSKSSVHLVLTPVSVPSNAISKAFVARLQAYF